MARITKQQLLKENTDLKNKISELQQEIRTLEAKLNYYSTIEKQVGAMANGCLSWFGGFVPKQDAKQ